MAAVENPVLSKHYAANQINILKSVIVNGNKMQGKKMFIAAPEEIYFQN
jgi:hypothetical protein